jgi:type II secretory pathway pseudopilin PulG
MPPGRCQRVGDGGMARRDPVNRDAAYGKPGKVADRGSEPRGRECTRRSEAPTPLGLRPLPASVTELHDSGLSVPMTARRPLLGRCHDTVACWRQAARRAPRGVGFGPGRSRAGAPRVSAFTMAEMLVVLGIVVIVALLILPMVSKARDASRSANCLSNLRQLGVCFRMYAQDHGGRLPEPAESEIPWETSLTAARATASSPPRPARATTGATPATRSPASPAAVSPTRCGTTSSSSSTPCRAGTRGTG